MVLCDFLNLSCLRIIATSHIDKLCSAISSKISLLRKLSTYVSIEVQKKFYQGYIQPLIDYGSITWGGTSLVNLERVLKLQKRAARIILNADFSIPSKDMGSGLDTEDFLVAVITVCS